MTDEHIEEHVDVAFAVWKPIFTMHPDRDLWWIDAGRQWHFYDRYFDVHDQFYRGLLGRLLEADAERNAHVNAGGCGRHERPNSGPYTEGMSD